MNPPHDILTTTDVFLTLAGQLKVSRYTNCGLDHIVLNLNETATPLPSPSPGLRLKYLAIGRGIQNYTCPTAPANSKDFVAEKPTAVGAVATLYDASCAIGSDQKFLHTLPNFLARVMMESIDLAATFAGLTNPTARGAVLGVHYFTNTSSPFFDFRLGGGTEWINAKKVASVPAPTSNVDVPWLKLDYDVGLGIQEVYRVHTSNGGAPADCDGLHGPFQIGYAAEYWFYG
ncbi:malate dehydrogenase [Aspergillus ellipticus CBS 707.79]|uniref:Malate dehydrogenase n=1 Tax=Aspergillus ellipticus CBS 707.79 TaxID=1448320 RepID=A0A319DDG5_9EURO|nr:malate dehydrogenase [Aspergillus ellipticus CBS 707.79]